MKNITNNTLSVTASKVSMRDQIVAATEESFRSYIEKVNEYKFVTTESLMYDFLKDRIMLPKEYDGLKLSKKMKQFKNALQKFLEEEVGFDITYSDNPDKLEEYVRSEFPYSNSLVFFDNILSTEVKLFTDMLFDLEFEEDAEDIDNFIERFML